MGSKHVSKQTILPGAGETISELAAVAASIKLIAELLRRFIDATLKEWRESIEGAAIGGPSGQGTQPPSLSTLQPLLDMVFAMQIKKEEQEKIGNICRLSLGGDHLA